MLQIQADPALRVNQFVVNQNTWETSWLKKVRLAGNQLKADPRLPTILIVCGIYIVISSWYNLRLSEKDYHVTAFNGQAFLKEHLVNILTQ